MVDRGKGHRAGVLPWKAPALRHAESDAHNVWEDFSATYEACLPLVVRYTLARVPDPGVAEDLVSDTFEPALRGWLRFGEVVSGPRRSHLREPIEIVNHVAIA